MKTLKTHSKVAHNRPKTFFFQVLARLPKAAQLQPLYVLVKYLLPAAQTRKISSDLNEALLLVAMVLKKNLVYDARAMEHQRNQGGQVFAFQETRNRLQLVLERRRQAEVTEANNATSTTTTNPASEASTSTSIPTTTPMTTPAAVPNTKGGFFSERADAFVISSNRQT